MSQVLRLIFLTYLYVPNPKSDAAHSLASTVRKVRERDPHVYFNMLCHAAHSSSLPHSKVLKGKRLLLQTILLHQRRPSIVEITKLQLWANALVDRLTDERPDDALMSAFLQLLPPLIGSVTPAVAHGT